VVILEQTDRPNVWCCIRAFLPIAIACVHCDTCNALLQEEMPGVLAFLIETTVPQSVLGVRWKGWARPRS